MAFPVITYNASTGSDTAASGAGPATAVTGTAAAHTGGAGSTTITLTNSPDLSGVAADGSAAIWINMGSGTRHHSKIVAVDDGLDTVTVEDTFNIAGASAKDYAIGGERQNPSSGSRGGDWLDTKIGWIVEFDAGNYDTALTMIPTAGAIVSGATELLWRAKAGAASRPVLRMTADANVMQFAGNSNYRIEGLKFQVTSVGKLFTHINCNSASACITFYDCVFEVGTSTQSIEVRGTGTKAFIGCHFQATNANPSGAITLASDDAHSVVVYGCTFDGAGGPGTFASAVRATAFGSDEAGWFIIGNLIHDCTSHGIDLAQDFNRPRHIIANTVVDCAGSGIRLPAGAGITGSQGVVMNNLLAFNGAYGIDGVDGVADAAIAVADFNFFYSNTSGPRNFTSAGANDVALTADPFTDRSSGDYSLNNTAGGGAAVRGAGFPGAFPNGT